MESTKKLDGVCDEDLFWKEVKLIGWGDGTLDTDVAKRRLLHRWTQTFTRSFNVVLSTFFDELTVALDRWQEDAGRYLECGDDWHMDLRHHIIGQGKAQFEKILKDPSIAYDIVESGSYAESFSYCIPNPGKENPTLSAHDKEDCDEEEQADLLRTQSLGDWTRVDEQTYVKWARDNIEAYTDALDNPLSSNIKHELRFCIQVMKPVAEACDFTYMLANKTEVLHAVKKIDQYCRGIVEEAREFNALVPTCSVENLCNDIERYLS